MKTANERIKRFWEWFSEHRGELSAPYISSKLVAELEHRLFAVERLDWEIGPGDHSSHLFALSPRGVPTLLQVTRQMIAAAPRMSEWEFWPAKPPRKWDLIFSLAVDDREIEIDAKLWEFVAYKFGDETFELAFKPDDPRDLSADDLHWAATIIVDGEIGEERRMELVGQIDVVATWDRKAAASARKLEHGILPKVLNAKA